MKITTSSKDWTPWYAWHPVEVNQDGHVSIVWFEYLERRKNRFDDWEYRFPPEPTEPDPGGVSSGIPPKPTPELNVTNVVRPDFKKKSA